MTDSLITRKRFIFLPALLGLITYTLLVQPAISGEQKPLHRTIAAQPKSKSIKKASLKDVFTTKLSVSKEVFTLKSKAIKTSANLNPRVLQLALKAHTKARSLGLARKQLITIIDYSLPSTQPRLWVFDTLRNKVIYHTHVAHGSGSGDNHARHFSDVPGSYQSSLGVFLTGDTYQGKHGLSLNLHGLEKGINGNAHARRIVIHAADYVSPLLAKSKGRIGRSWGCPALSNQLAKPIIQTIKDGSLIFAYYPDEKWLKRSQFL